MHLCLGSISWLACSPVPELYHLKTSGIFSLLFSFVLKRFASRILLFMLFCRCGGEQHSTVNSALIVFKISSDDMAFPQELGVPQPLRQRGC